MPLFCSRNGSTKFLYDRGAYGTGCVQPEGGQRCVLDKWYRGPAGVMDEFTGLPCAAVGGEAVQDGDETVEGGDGALMDAGFVSSCDGSGAE